jgi:DNA-binding NtrC family response regulator
MVYGFVRQTNGFINIESQVDQGTKVHLYLPYTPAPLTHLSGDGSERVVNTGVSATVLVVEDDLDVLKVVSELLTDMEYTVLTASNAPDALETIKQKADDIHLIFSDVVMPGGVSGIDMARELRNRHPHIPVLLTSGFVSQSTECNVQVDSEFEILRKPYSRSDLSDAIQKLLFHQHEANTRLSSLC